jgi:hypothetical protein
LIQQRDGISMQARVASNIADFELAFAHEAG